MFHFVGFVHAIVELRLTLARCTASGVTDLKRGMRMVLP